MATTPTMKVKIYRTDPPPRTEVGEVAAGVRSYQVCGLPSGTAHSFVAVALDAQGAASADSAAATATTLQPIAPPDHLAVAEATATTVRLTWEWQRQTRADASGFSVQFRKKGAADWSPELALGADDIVARTHTFEGLAPATDYEFRVWATFGSQRSDAVEISAKTASQ